VAADGRREGPGADELPDSLDVGGGRPVVLERRNAGADERMEVPGAGARPPRHELEGLRRTEGLDGEDELFAFVPLRQHPLAADAFVEQWVDDEEAMERADASPEVAAAWEGVPKYAEMTGTWWVTKEHVYIPPPITGPGRLSRQAWLA